MTTPLNAAVSLAVTRLAVETPPTPPNSSTLVQFAAGDWENIKSALALENADEETTTNEITSLKTQLAALTDAHTETQAQLSTATTELNAIKAELSTARAALAATPAAGA